MQRSRGCAALADSAEQPTYLETLAWRGYRFIANVYEKGGYPGVLKLPLEQLREKSKGTYVSALDFAELYAELGNTEEAFARLGKACKNAPRSFFL